MDYELTAPTSAADKALARRAEKGVESFIYYSYEPITEIAEIEFSDAAAATLTTVPDIADYLGAGKDLQAYIKWATLTDAEIKATVNCDGATTPGMACTATWKRRAWTTDQTYNAPQFMGVDVVPASDELLDAINSLTSVTGGASGMKLGICVLPSTWYPIDCKLSCNIVAPSPETSPIACGYDPSYETALVRSEPGTITVSANHRGAMEGLARLTGLPQISVRIDTKKDGRLVVQRDVVGGVTFKVSDEKGENDANVVDEATSMFSKLLRFI